MPRMVATSSVESGGMRRTAARSSAALYELRRRLPEIPNTLVMTSPLNAPAGCPARRLLATARACRRQRPAPQPLLLQLGGHLAVGLAERQAAGCGEPVGLFGGVNGGIEPDRLRAELQRADGWRQDGERRRRQVDAAEQRELQQLQVAL